MLNIVAIHSHVYKRWKNILRCMIEKDKGSAKIHRLWVIHLYECDLNLLLGLFLRKFDQHYKDNGMINKGTYRSGANRRVVDPVIVDVTPIEILIITRMILVQFNNYATAWFDRIIPSILSLYLRSYQMPPESTSLLKDLQRHAKYAIRTANGVSKAT